MKKGLENIDEVVKQAFEGFEADVDPNVWNNVQSAITTEAVATSGTSGSAVGKSTVLKFVAGFVTIGTIATAIYLFSENSSTDQVAEVSPELPLKSNEWLPEDLIVEDRNQNEKNELTKSEQQKTDIKESDNLERFNSKNNKKTLEVLPPVNNEENDIIEGVNNQDLNKEKDSSNSPQEKLEPVKAEKIVPVEKENTEKIVVGDIQVSVTSGKAPLDVMFDVEGENIASYLWDFGDYSSTSSEASVLHTFNEPGVYQVKLIVLDKNANPKTLIKVISVEKSITSRIGVIQSGFTPNGDGNNDLFLIKTGENIETFHATIKSLKGELIFQWNNIEEGWNGRNQSGVMMPEGRYILTVLAKGIDGVEHPRTKIIMLTK
ncbi:MAG: PKD domain-containing protein [Vicingaceae bacterium]